VSGIGPSIHVLDGVLVPQDVQVDFGILCSHWPNGFNGVVFNRNVFDLCVKS